jgi:hypothetical protein
MTATDAVCEDYTQRWDEVLDDPQPSYLPEKYQLGVLLAYLRRHEFRYATEAQVAEFPLDILAGKRDISLIIEMKSGNSKRGMVQARRNAKFAEYSFLSVWEDNVTEQLLQRVADTPVGLISVSDRVSFLSPPEKNDKFLCTREYIDDVLNDTV